MLGTVLLLLVIAGAGVGLASAQPSGAFIPAGDMTTPRSAHTASLLPDGKVLIAGGSVSSSLSGRELILTSAELYDSVAGSFAPTGEMSVARKGHTSTLLGDGSVLIAGGYSTGGAVAAAERYDLSTGMFTATGSMINARAGHTAILLSTGKVLIVGGYGTGSYPYLAPAEIYDPVSGTFTVSGSYAGHGGCDFCAPAVGLPDGRILFPGQIPAQLYDPISESFSLSKADLSSYSTAILLKNGKVLLAGGETTGRSAKAGLYDPATDTFASTADMVWPRVWHTLTLLGDGMVLAAGGETDSCAGSTCMFAGSVASAELYDSSTGTFVVTGSMNSSRETHTATLLTDGRVLVTGGVAYGGIGAFFGTLASAELYNPPAAVLADPK